MLNKRLPNLLCFKTLNASVTASRHERSTVETEDASPRWLLTFRHGHRIPLARQPIKNNKLSCLSVSFACDHVIVFVYGKAHDIT